jgi:hypothetical protein
MCAGGAFSFSASANFQQRRRTVWIVPYPHRSAPHEDDNASGRRCTVAKSDTDRTLETRSIFHIDEDDVAAAQRTCKLPILSEEAAQDTLETPRAKSIADRTQEVRAEDVLEIVDAREATGTPTSIAPLAIELPPRQTIRPRSAPPSESTSSFGVRLGPPRRLRLIVEVVMGGSLLILAAAVVRSAMSWEPEATPIVLVSPGTHAAPPPRAMDVPSPVSAPTTGTVARVAGARVELDGVRVTATSAVVPCGAHMLKVGAEKPRTVDVPCGGTFDVAPNGRTAGR